MQITQEEFDELVRHTLRIELLSGLVLIYRVSIPEKQRLIGRLQLHSDSGEDGNHLPFLHFETSLCRQVVIAVPEIVRIIFCFDVTEELEDPNGYYDNFKVLEKDTNIVEAASPEGKGTLHVVTQEFLPSAIVYHKGEPADDGYDSNPLLYYGAESGCLDTLATDLDDDNVPARQFINIMDMDGEPNFIAMKHVVVLEFDADLMYDAEYEESDKEDEDLGDNISKDFSDDMINDVADEPQAPGDDDLPF